MWKIATLVIIILVAIRLLLKSTLDDIIPKIKQSNDLGFNVCVSHYRFGKQTKKDNTELYRRIDAIDTSFGSDIYTRNKISIRVDEINIDKFYELLDYAKMHNVFIWIAATDRHANALALKKYYEATSRGYYDIGITLQAYHQDSYDKAKNILATVQHAHIRLVYGAYTDNKLNHKDTLANYRRIANLLAYNDNFHELAGHRFDIIRNFAKYDNLAFSFYELNKSYVIQQIAVLKKDNIEIKNKTLYINYGDILNIPLSHHLTYITQRLF